MVNRIFDDENFLIARLILKGRSNGKIGDDGVSQDF